MHLLDRVRRVRLPVQLLEPREHLVDEPEASPDMANSERFETNSAESAPGSG